VVDLIRYKKFSWHLVFATGGMPSSHSAIVVSTAVSTGLNYGFQSAVFALATVFAFIVMYDAQGIRRAAGKHAYLINIIIKTIEDPKVSVEDTVNELLGHTPLQVAAGAILGVIIAIIMN